ncbi:MAG TPA: glycosyltransferase family 2 protein [Spirochaetia bacterium]|nr:glycosyltransferase family 2 protein [Spirochaetia bacterium]
MDNTVSLDVSVIIVSWNTIELLRDCLHSVFEQSAGVRMEVVCVDNASTDGSAEMVLHEFPSVRLIRNSVNLRFVAANNQAISVARGKFVLLLNSDTVVLDRAIARIVSFGESRPAGAVFGGRVLNSDGSLQRSCFMYPSVANQLFAALYLYKLFPGSRLFGRQLMTWWDYAEEREVQTVSGCFALVRKAAIEQVGMMDPLYYFYGDDHDWCYRFAKAGWKVIYTPEPQIIHYGGQSTSVRRRAFALQLHGSVLLFMRLHRTRVSFCAVRLLIAAYMFFRTGPWALKAMVFPRERDLSIQTAGTCLIGGLLALFNWKHLLMNREDVELRLQHIHSGRHENGNGFHVGVPVDSGEGRRVHSGEFPFRRHGEDTDR